jgi:hypothetical protein
MKFSDPSPLLVFTVLNLTYHYEVLTVDRRSPCHRGQLLPHGSNPRPAWYLPLGASRPARDRSTGRNASLACGDGEERTSMPDGRSGFRVQLRSS